VSHRIVWSGWSFWLMIQNDQPFLDALTLGLTALITWAVAGLGLRPAHVTGRPRSRQTAWVVPGPEASLAIELGRGAFGGLT
jgi:hypothetical protein